MPVEHGAAHLGRALTVAVDPAFTLFVAGGVPGQVVVHDGREQVLQVDAFGEAVGGHQHAASAVVGVGQTLAHLVNVLATLFGCQLARDGLDGGLGEVLAQFGRHVVGRGHVTAEHYRGEPVLQQAADVGHQRGELGVTAGAAEALGRGDEGLQLLRAGLGLQLGSGLEVEDGQVFSRTVVQVAELGVVAVVVTACREATFQPRVQRLGGRSGGRGHAAQQGQRGVPDQPGATLVAGLLHGFGQFAAVGLHVVEEAAPGTAEAVGELGFHAAREARAVLRSGLPFGNVFAAALHELARQLVAQRVVFGGAMLQLGEGWVQQRQQVEEGHLVARMGCGGEQQQVAVVVSSQALQQLEAQLLAGTAGRAGVGLVDDDAPGRDGQEVFAVALALDVVQAHHHHGVVVEQAHAMRKLAFQPAGAGGGERHGGHVEALLQLALPLLDQVRGAEHGHALDFAAVHQFAHDERGFDGLADADVVANQQAHGGQAQRHQQRHQLVGPRLHGDVAEAAEGAGAGAQLQAQGVTQQQRRAVVAGLGWVGGVELGRVQRLKLQFGQQRDDVVVSAAQRPQPQG